MDEHHVVIITGASSGIGYATAIEFARQGYVVVGTARRKERLDALGTAIAQELNTQDRFLGLECDVQDAASVDDVIRTVIEKLGRIDVLVANAGVGHRGSIVDSAWEDIETLLRTNMDGVLHSIRAAVPHMRKQGGHVIIVSSVVYNMTSPYAAYYAASKAFVSSIAHSLRLELESEGIRVTDMIIGRTHSEFNENRLGKSGRTGGGIPVMPVEKVAMGIYRASLKNKRSMALRWLDRLLVMANLIVPERIGRMAMKQYR